MTDDNQAQAARIIADHRLQRRALPPLPAPLRPANERAGYALQDRVHALLTADGSGPIVGHKIGCTTKVMQAFLAIENPCAGGVFASTVHTSPARVAHADFVRVGVECEMVVRLDRDLPFESAPFTRAGVAAAVGALMAGMEIVDERYTDFKTLGTPTLIADDFFDAGCVVGAPLTDWQALDLATLTGTTSINETEVGRGRGADVMGHPFEALAWLANTLAQRGRSLRAGEFVFTGSVVETKWLDPGDAVKMTIENVGTVEAVFE
ncbi:MAG: fumarylacetoacetate hydrolase family protein [Betaproteobacteria bacterium]